jgi:hypothetical protein
LTLPITQYRGDQFSLYQSEPNYIPDSGIGTNRILGNDGLIVISYEAEAPTISFTGALTRLDVESISTSSARIGKIIANTTNFAMTSESDIQFASLDTNDDGKVSIGYQSGLGNKDINAVSVGAYAGYINQNIGAVAIGREAGRYDQQNRGIAVGFGAGYSNQGEYSVAIGVQAGYQNQSTQTIVLNATATELNTTRSGSLYAAPIATRPTANNFSTLFYDDGTKEVFAGPSGGGGGGGGTQTIMYCGTGETVDEGGGLSYGTTITFPTPFNQTPCIFLTHYAASPVTSPVSFHVGNPSPTQFNVYSFWSNANIGGSGLPVEPGPGTFFWQAISTII